MLLVSHTAAAESRSAGMWSAAGVATAAVVWAAGAAIGLGLLLERVAGLETALRVLGGLYLVYLGVRIGFFTSRVSWPEAVRGHRSVARRWWWRGLLTNLSNPKAAVFYLSIFATSIPAGATLATRSAVVVAIGINSLLWHELLAVGFSTAGARALYLRSQVLINRIAGTVMIVFGVLLALEAR